MKLAFSCLSDCLPALPVLGKTALGSFSLFFCKQISQHSIPATIGEMFLTMQASHSGKWNTTFTWKNVAFSRFSNSLLFGKLTWTQRNMFYSKLKAIFLTQLTRGYLEGAHRLLLLHVVSLFHAFVYIQIPLKNAIPSSTGLFFPGGAFLKSPHTVEFTCFHHTSCYPEKLWI